MFKKVLIIVLLVTFLALPQAEASQIFKELNKDKIVYAATLSNNELEIMYTRLNSFAFESMRYTRTNKHSPFGKPERIKGITGHAEAPAITGNGKMIYYHKREDAKGRFKLYALRRRHE